MPPTRTLSATVRVTRKSWARTGRHALSKKVMFDSQAINEYSFFHLKQYYTPYWTTLVKKIASFHPRMVGLIGKLLASTKSAVQTNISQLILKTNMSSSSQSGSRKAVLIFLHGLGDQGSSWQMQLAPMMPSHVKCICPTAPTQPVTLNMGMRMNSWFDLRSLSPLDPEDDEGIESACKRIHEIIADQEKQGVPHDRIMLGGFSQGGALSLYSALTYPKKLAGVVALSCWLPLHRRFPAAATQANKDVSVLQCHGDQDCVVPLPWGKASEVVLSSFLDKNSYKFKVYTGMGHSSCTSELNDVLEFVRKHLPK